MTEEHAEIEQKLREFFEVNFEILKLESGHTITEDTKRLAWNQVLYYWKKLNGIAQHVTDTEVRLCLPNQKTKKRRTFSIDGLVDIVREHGETWMYDIKTHDADYIRGNRDFYENQLNVYTYIWQKLRENKLDHTAIISTAYPKTLRDAIHAGDLERIEKAIQEWDPVIDMPFSQESVERTVKDFGEVVDEIEDNLFSSPPIKKLEEKVPGTDRTFVNRVCSNCDTRFTCPSFRKYITTLTKGVHTKFKKYVDIAGDDLDQEEWVNANLEASEGSLE
jgi:hypothetical protein